MPGDVLDVITRANFGEDRLRDFCVARGRILAFFPLNFVVALTTRLRYFASAR